MKLTKFFNIIFSLFHNNCSVLERLRLNSVGRFLTRKIANEIIPIWYRVTKVGEGTIRNSRTVPVIFSLTSFPSRIERVWIALESLLRQTVKPDRLILWLSLEQFPKKELDLPKSLISLKERGVEIEFVEEDIKSHKKYYYVMSRFPDSIIVTVDDDIYYPEDMLENLLREHEKNPKSVICRYARCLQWEENGINPTSSSKWKRIRKNAKGNDIFFGTGGGVLFPPMKYSLYKDTLDKDLFLILCPKEDDLWLNTMVKLQGTNVIALITEKDILPILQKEIVTLFSINGGEGCLTDIQMKNTIDYYMKENLYPYKNENICNNSNI